MKYYIIAGEASGDLHASNLMQGIMDEDSNADFRFFGGDLMASKGGVLVRHYRNMAFMGFLEVLMNIRQISKNLQYCKQDIISYNPDVLILVDYPGFNLRIAKFAKRAGIKVFYYIAPKVWAWKESRVKSLRCFVDKLFVIFPFEVEYFKRHGIDVVYCGNPLVDAIGNKTQNGDFRKQNNLDSRPIIAILAGSRLQEIAYNLPVMLSLEPLLKDYQLVIAGAPSLDMEVYSPHIDGTGTKIVFGQTQELLSEACLAVVTSGTATLEAALLDVPEVVCYKGNTISMLIASMVVKIKWISLVNLIMQREVVKELIQFKLTRENLFKEVEKLLPNKPGRVLMKEDFAELRVKLGHSGASKRFASEMVTILRKD